MQDGALINALRVEPALGTPARGGLPATTARRTASGWSISGHKIFSTGIPVLRWLLVWGRTDEEHPRVGAWLVPADAPGITVIRTWDQLGMRATESHDVVLADVAVPFDHAVDIRDPAAWGKPDTTQVAWNTVLIASLYHGIAVAAQDWLAGYLHRRAPSSLGASLATVPRIQTEVGLIASDLRTGARLLRSAAEAFDAGRPDAPDSVEYGLIKRSVVGGAIAAVERAVQLIGNPGLSRANPLERHLRDVLCGRIHTPQDDMVLLAAGQAALAPFATPFAGDRT